MFGIVGLLTIAIAAWAAESPEKMKEKAQQPQQRQTQPFWKVERDPKKLPLADGPQDRGVDNNWDRNATIIQDNYIARGGLGVTGPTAPGLKVATTTWDMQHNDAAPHMCGTTGSGQYIHFSWTHWDVIPESLYQVNRFVNFNTYNSAGAGSFLHGVNGATISGAGGNPIHAHAGFVTLDVDNSDRAVVSFHQRGLTEQPPYPCRDYSSWVLAQDAPNFPSFIQYSLAGSKGITCDTTDDKMWPHVSVKRPGPPTYYHVLAHTRLADDHIFYWRFKSTDPEPKWKGPFLVDSCSALSYNVAVDRTTSKCAIVTENDYDPVSNPSYSWQIVYRESSSDGDDWGPVSSTGLGDAKRNFITSYDHTTGPEAWLECVGDYDNSGNLHVIWTERRYPLDNRSTQAALKHWDKTSNNITTAAFGYWDNAGYIGGRKINLAFPSIGFGDGSTTCGAGTNFNYLYVTYTQFGGNSVAQQNDSSARGLMNGEIILSSSRDGGFTWAPPVNLTNSLNPGCDPTALPADPCPSENWASIARTVDDTLHIQYIADQDAGDAVLGNGTWTFNPVMYYRIPGGTNVQPVCPLFSPYFAAELSNANGPECEYHTPPNTSINETLTLKNSGNATMNGTISVVPPASWLTVGSPTYEIPAGSGDLPFTVTMNAAGLAEGYYHTTISITHNDQTKIPPYVIPVDFFVYNHFYCSGSRALHTSRLELEVSNTERVAMARYSGLRGLYRPPYALSGTPPTADAGNNSIYDGSLIIARPPVDISKPPDGILDTVVYRYLFGQGNYAKGFRALSDLDVDTSQYGTGAGFAYGRAKQTTVDSTIGIDVDYIFPQAADSSEFVLIKYRIYNRTSNTITGLTPGEAVDFDVVPSTQYAPYQTGAENGGSWSMNWNLVYQYGIDAGATTFAQKYLGGMTAIQCTQAPRAWIAPNDGWLYHRPGGGFHEGYLYQELLKTGFEIIPPNPPPSSGGVDLHSVIAFEKNVTLTPTAEKHYLLALVSSTQGPATTDLMQTVKKAWRYAFGWQDLLTLDELPPNTSASYRYFASGSHENGLAGGCCGCVVTETSDPSGKFSFTPDADPCTGTINFAGAEPGTYTATFRVQTPACAGPQYTEDRVVTILVPSGTQEFCFNPAVNYAAGDAPTSVFAADLDGNGDQDLAVANYVSDNVSVLKNNGDGTFAAAVNYAVGDAPQSVFAADLDGDGHADLAVANASFYPDNGNVSVLKNNGDGTFAAPVNYAAHLNPTSVFAADLDGDGDQDLAIANEWSDNVSVLKNNGDGTFAAALNYEAGNAPYSVFAADLDGDGHADLAVANGSSDNVSVLKNNGDGTFAAAVNYAAGDAPISVFAAHLDGDGKLDLAVANYSSANVSVLKNNGDGTFAAAVNYAAGDDARSVFVADLNGDSDADLVVTDSWNGNVSVLKNNGDGTFAAAVNYATGEFWPTSVSVFAADLDGDNDVDLAVANFNSASVSVLINCISVGDALSVTGYSPIWLTVIDPKNDSIGVGFNTIGAAVYDTLTDQDGDLDRDSRITIFNPLLGTYQVRVVAKFGADPGATYSLGVRESGKPGTLLVSDATIPPPGQSVLFDVNLCECNFQGDINGDGFIDVFDVIDVIGIAFSGGTDPKDPQCPTTRGDVDNSGVVDVFDVIYLIATAFSGGPNPVNPCAP